MPSLLVVGSAEIAGAIRLEATLSFLGLGLPITQPSLGLMIANGFQYMLSGQYWISFYPGLALLIVVSSLNTIGDHIRDVTDPRHAT
jgi:peptide/nickel transport system permease protein